MPMVQKLTREIYARVSLLHLDIAVDDFGSNPIIRLSIGTKMPPPPTPPTLPNAAPQNPIKVPKTIRHPNSISCIPSNNNNHKLHLLNNP
jgi:hypothetical protein